jgi:hypothetical protein
VLFFGTLLRKTVFPAASIEALRRRICSNSNSLPNVRRETVLIVHPIHYPMFDFEKIIVYQKSKDFNSNVHSFLLKIKLDKNTFDQLKRAALSFMINIAEGSGRFTKPGKKNFYIISRGSAFECLTIFDF